MDQPLASLPRMRVLSLTWRDQDNPEAGGAEVFTERTAQYLADQGHQITLHTALFPGGLREQQHGQVRVIRAGNRFTCYPRGLWHLWRHRQNYDLILDTENGVPFWAPLVARVPVITIVHHVHREQWRAIFGPLTARLGWFLESRVAPWVYRKSHYVTVSQASRDELAEIGVDPTRVDIVYSGNDAPAQLDRFATMTRSPTPMLLFLGRLVPHKHVEDAIDVLNGALANEPCAELHIAGTGYWFDQLAAYARDQGLADRVILHGHVDEETKHALLARAWVLVQPSHKEGWGLTIIEAGQHGTPSVALASAGGPSESIVDGQTGLLARDPSDFAHCVARLVNDENLRNSLGTAARAHALAFNWERSGARLETIMQATLGRLPQPGEDLMPTLNAPLPEEPAYLAE